MNLALTDKTLQVLRAYLRETKGTRSEIGKREQFTALLGSLFPNTREVGIYARGAEKSLRIQLPDRNKRGSVDTLYGGAVVEFEKSLKHTQAEAERQLREYVAGIWQAESLPHRALDAVATDGVCWRIYRPVLPAGAPLTPASILLELRREIPLAENTLGDFYRWLNLFLFRPANVEPTSENIRFDFGSSSHIFMEGMAFLRHAWVAARRHSEARLAFETWRSYLTVTYGKLGESDRAERDKETGESLSELDELFLRHTWLVSVARLMVWAALSAGNTKSTLRQAAADVFSGTYFKSRQLANLTDDDFFHWIRSGESEPLLAPAWERVLDLLLSYDLQRMSEDVLKGVYQDLIDPKDRHDLGEYYTPDWLCERIVSEMLPVEGYKKVLDPSCGSGSFLRASIHHYTTQNTGGTEHDRLRAVLASVQGIDIHPVAVTIARANYVLALGRLVSAARRPIQIPVYLADSLFLPREVEKNLLEQLSGIEISFGPRRNKRFTLPAMLVNQPENFDDAIAAAVVVAESHAERSRETREQLSTYLHKAAPALSEALQREDIVSALWEFVLGLSELIQLKQNSIWSFIIRNSYRPAMLRQQFDVILGNPPWVSYRYITDPEYQAEIKRRAVDEYKIAPSSQKLFTQMELATVFLAHSMSIFARPGARLAFVMPRSVLTADQHQNLIQRTYSAPFRLTGYWDLWDVQPLFNVPSCVLFAEQSPRHGKASDVLPASIWQGRLSGRDLSWTQASARLSVSEKEARVIWLGSRSALSTEKGAATVGRASPYAPSFKQGATIVPRNFYFVSVAGLRGSPDPERLYACRTDEDAALAAKKPYQDVRLQGNVEGRFLFSTAVARHVLPFAFLQPAPVVLPLEEENGRWYTTSAQTLRRKGFRDCAAWFEEVERTWIEKRGPKIRQTATAWLDYSGKLTAQSPTQRHLVLYNAAGTNVSACYCDRHAQPLPFVVEHKLYWAAVSDPAEAHYLTALLNSDTANRAIKPFQSTGLLGERDIEKKLLDIPFPLFDANDPLHRQLSELGLRAHEQARAALADPGWAPNTSLARQRAAVRTAVSDLLSNIDGKVQELLARR